jgi:hypothetical protein
MREPKATEGQPQMISENPSISQKVDGIIGGIRTSNLSAPLRLRAKQISALRQTAQSPRGRTISKQKANPFHPPVWSRFVSCRTGDFVATKFGGSFLLYPIDTDQPCW